MKPIAWIAIAAIAAWSSSLMAQTHGSLEFAAGGTFTPPKGVKQVTVELWGAGGNGGAGDSSGGGGGGAGGYARGIVNVKRNQTYTVTVGNASAPQRDSKLSDALGVDHISAQGGADGGAGSVASGGNGGSGGAGLPTTMLTRPGGGGAGGHGSGIPAATPGGRGHVILSW
jgi:hypothetical protein